MKIKIALLLTVCFLLSVLAGCSTNNSTPADSISETSPDSISSAPEELPAEAPENASTSTQEENLVSSVFPLEESVTLSYMNTFNPSMLTLMDGQQDVSVEKEYERLTNVHIEYMNLSPDVFAEKFNVLLLSNDLPDFIQDGMSYYAGGGAAAVEDGYFVNLNDYLEYMPNYQADIESKTVLRKAAYAADGVIPAQYSVQSAYNTNGVIVRQDWLDQLNMDVPTTYDEIESVLTAMKLELGIEYPLILPSFLDYQYNMFSGNFGAPGSFDLIGMSQQLFVVDGQVRYAQYTEEYEEYVRLITHYYELGLLDPDFIGYEMVRDYQDKINNGQVGLWLNSTTNLKDTTDAMDGTGAVFTGIPSPAKEAGQVNHLTTYQESVSPFGAVSIATKCSNIEVACQWLDYKTSDEIEHMFDFGLEGETYTLDENGNVTWTELITNNPDGLSTTQALTFYTGSDMGSSERQASMYTDYQKAAVEAWTTNVDGDYVFPSDITLSAEVSEEASLLLGDIRTYISESVLQFVVGAKSLDDFEDFRTQLKNMQIERVIEIYQDAYDAYMAD